jgi:uncharacterized protein
MSVPDAPAIAWSAPGRLALVDTLRAIALFGVIAMNMMGMAMAFVSEQVLADMGPLDQLFGAFDMFFLRGKARCMFAFLFGFGFGVLLLRAQGRGQAIVPFYLRRMLILLGFGVVNQLFLFWGDILIAYALVGMVLLLFRDLDDRRLLVLGSLLVLLPPILRGAYEALIGPAPQLVAGDGDATYDAMLAVYRSAPYGLEVVRANWSHLPSEWLHETAKRIVVDLGVLGLFLLGFWVARRGILSDVESHRPLLRRVAWIALPIGFVLSALNGSAQMGWEPGQPLAGLQTAAYIGLPIMGFGYLALFSLWLSRGGAWLQRLLAPTGRMALTYYLASGLLGSAFYYAWGLGMLERLGMAEMNLFAIAMYAAMVAFSHVWLHHFRLGPAEWLWRRLNGAMASASLPSEPMPR